MEGIASFVDLIKQYDHEIDSLNCEIRTIHKKKENATKELATRIRVQYPMVWQIRKGKRIDEQRYGCFSTEEKARSCMKERFTSDRGWFVRAEVSIYVDDIDVVAIDEPTDSPVSP